jgi:hypothetical protein
MFCPSCGIEYTIELKYCNRCGANLSPDLEIQPSATPVSVVKPAIVIGAVMTIMTVFGFGLLIAGGVELSHNARIDPGAVTAIVIVGMVTILTMDIFLVRLLSKIINASLSSGPQTKPRRPKAITNPTPVQLPQPPTARLQEVPSITEGTTRFFEPYRGPVEGSQRPTGEKLERKIES